MTKIFISYRNSDSSVWAGRIYDSIKNKFGHGSVFKADRDSNIDYGKKFPEVLRTSVLNCVVCIVCIGKSWLDTLNKRKSSKDVDWVKEEIRLALKNKKVIIPILLDGAEMPSKGDLPRGLKSLYDNQGLKITNDSTFHQDIDNLIKSLENHLHSVNNVINDIYQLIDQFTEAYQSKDYEPQQSLDILYRIQSRDDIPSYFDINDYQNELEKIKDNLEKERLTEQQYGTIIKALHSGSPVNKIVDGFKDFWRINPDYDPQNYKITHSGIIYNILPQPFEWVYLGTRRIIVHSKNKNK